MPFSSELAYFLFASESGSNKIDDSRNTWKRYEYEYVRDVRVEEKKISLWCSEQQNQKLNPVPLGGGAQEIKNEENSPCLLVIKSSPPLRGLRKTRKSTPTGHEAALAALELELASLLALVALGSL